MVSLGPNVFGTTPPKPDLPDPITTEAGIRKRFLYKPPSPNPFDMNEFKAFVAAYVSKIVPLSSDSDTSVESWLFKCNQPAWRKVELQKLWNDHNGVLNPSRDFVVKSFVKDETYVAFKHARGINSRSDMFKCAVGPIFKLIEEQIYKLPHFIKKVPVADRPKYITDLLYFEGAKYLENDFVAFESLFTREVMEACEFQLYEHMVSSLPDGPAWMKLVRDVIGGTNHCVFKYFTVDVEATRMSGEMNTSLGNGFTNLMLLLFLFSRRGIQANIVVEGDDSLSSFVGEPPTDEEFKALGFVTKLSVRENLNEASFCGLIFNPSDMINITDPLDVLANFGWAGRNYVNAKQNRLMALLRCKSLSYAHQYPGAPIIQSLAQYGLRVTAGRDVKTFIENDRSMSLWEREQLREAALSKLPKPISVPIGTRLLMERIYGVSVEAQLEIEKYLDGLVDVQELAGPILDLNFHPDFYRFADTYTMTLPMSFVRNIPIFSWSKDKTTNYEFTPIVDVNMFT